MFYSTLILPARPIVCPAAAGVLVPRAGGRLAIEGLPPDSLGRRLDIAQPPRVRDPHGLGPPALPLAHDERESLAGSRDEGPAGGAAPRRARGVKGRHVHEDVVVIFVVCQGILAFVVLGLDEPEALLDAVADERAAEVRLARDEPRKLGMLVGLQQLGDSSGPPRRYWSSSD